MKKHKERAHSKFSASGAERWFNCSASVALCEGLPSKDSEASLEGTKAHEVLEQTVRAWCVDGSPKFKGAPIEMISHASDTADFLMTLRESHQDADFLIEERVYLDFIHPDAFGSLDYAIAEHFSVLHVLDYKYGRHLVSPKGNLQFIFYALATAKRYDWNFERVRMWTMQPRVKGFNGFTFWDISIEELKSYIPRFKEAIWRVENVPEYREGEWCFFCKGKAICPLKKQSRRDQARQVFGKLK